jgi:hypothetical protein
MHLARKKNWNLQVQKKIKNKDIAPSIKTVIISDASVAKRQRTNVKIRNLVNQEYNSSVLSVRNNQFIVNSMIYVLTHI